MLSSLRIEGFRAFDQLKVERMGQVNLVVGKNNVGKSSLLEALRLYAHKGAASIVWEILSSRNELSHTYRANPEIDDRLKLAVERLFYDPQGNNQPLGTITIGPVGALEETVSITLAWYSEQHDAEGQRQLRLFESISEQLPKDLQLALAIRFGSQPKLILPLEEELRFAPRRWSRMESPTNQTVNCLYLSANGLKQSEIGYLWDKIALTDFEQDILFTLKIIAPSAERISLIGDPLQNRQRIAIVKMFGQGRPVPLSSMGDGMNRIFGIILGLVNAKDGMLLIDEIENGIHYTVQPELWSTIFKAAHRLNVQVFATTHSWDCISAFQQAVCENPQQDGLLIRLEAKKDKTEAVLFDKEELRIVTREQIEVR